MATSAGISAKTGPGTARVDGDGDSGPRSRRGDDRARLTFQPPRLSDPRLHVASVLISVQVLGQVSIGFDLSIAQILVALVTAAVIELLFTAPRTRVIAWPASALLTGNGVALLLRVPGTEHGDWFSLRGWYVFAATTALAMLSKYVIRADDRPLFNPSNVGMVIAFLVLGSQFADPQDLWWGPMSPGLALTYAVIVGGGLIVTRRLRLIGMSAAFGGVFAVLMAVLALSGHSMLARWNLGPVQGSQFWTTLVLSPETLIFLFFMITDPRTSARGRRAGLIYGGLVAAVSSVLISLQTTEYATKVALLSGLVLVCAGRPLIERLFPVEASGPAEAEAGADRDGGRRSFVVIVVLSVACVGVVFVAGSKVSPTIADPVAATGRRPQIELSSQQEPEVEIDDSLTELGGSFDAATAKRVVVDVIENLLVAETAAQDSEPEVISMVTAGEFRDELLDRLGERAPERTFGSAVVGVVRDPEDFQSIPRLAVTLEGTTDGAGETLALHVVPIGEDFLIERALS